MVAEFTARELSIALLVLRGEAEITELNPRQQAIVAKALTTL